MNRAKHHEMVVRDITRRNIKKFCYMHGDNPKKYKWNPETGLPMTIVVVKNPQAMDCIRSPKDIEYIRFLMDRVPTSATFDNGGGIDLQVENKLTEFDVGEWKDPPYSALNIPNEVHEVYLSWLEGLK